ncbi:Uncharacterised protein [Mycobacteroides abscessus subsp. abscessus]|nr:Uncharacterised protein [Mycobacteroides abscessus subsp. abscessus]
MDVLGELALGIGELDAVLRTLRSRDRGHDRGEVELEVLGVGDLVRRIVPQPLGLRVVLDELDLLGRAARELEVVDGDVVDREDRGGRAELWAHVADRRTVGQRHRGHALTVELDELADDAVLAEHVGDREDDVGGGHARGDLPGELEADDARDEHRDGLAEHRGLGLDAAHTPAEDAEAVDHRRVRVGADERVGVGAEHSVDLTRHDDAGEVFDVDLVDDAHAGRHDLEVVERGLAPAEELVALAVALVLDVHVALDRVGRAEGVDLDGVVDDELGRGERVDLVRIAAELRDLLTHRGEVDDAGHAGEVLHDHTGRGELDLRARVGAGIPVREGLDVLLGDVGTVFGAQQVLQQHLEAEGKLLRPGDRVEAIDLVVRIAHGQGALRFERIDVAHRDSPVSFDTHPRNRARPCARTDLRDTIVSKSILTSR